MGKNDDQIISVIDDSQEKVLTDNNKIQCPWHILVVDDEPVVHEATEFALKGEVFFGNSLQLHHAFSGREGFDILMNSGVDFFVALIDVVMETTDAGLN